MIYLEFIDWQDFADCIKAANIPAARIDILDASVTGLYRFYVVASCPIPKEGALAVCCNLVMEQEEPDFSKLEPVKQDAARAKFCDGMRKSLESAKDEPTKVLSDVGLRVRAGIYSIEPPPIFKLRK